MTLLWENPRKGPLYIGFLIIDDKIQLNIFVKHYDIISGHNNFIDIRKCSITKGIERLDAGLCPYCDTDLYFEYHDKFNKTLCRTCSYFAWSDKIYYV